MGKSEHQWGWDQCSSAISFARTCFCFCCAAGMPCQSSPFQGGLGLCCSDRGCTMGGGPTAGKFSKLSLSAWALAEKNHQGFPGPGQCFVPCWTVNWESDVTAGRGFCWVLGTFGTDYCWWRDWHKASRLWSMAAQCSLRQLCLMEKRA